MRFFVILLAAGWMAHGQSTTAAKKTAPPAAPTAKSSAKSTAKAAVQAKAAPKAAPKAGTKVAAAKSNSKSKRTVVARRPVQQQPTMDRYKEIQQALAERGYFSGTVDGNWGPESTDSLKRFQKDQGLETDGKIGALSLIALGLGPKRGAAAAENLAAPGAKPEPVDPPPVAQPDAVELAPGAQPEK